VAAALLDFLDDPAAGRTAGGRAARLVTERFAWPASADQMLRVYRWAVAGAEVERIGQILTNGRAA
jgi:hypothetical protein